MPSCVRQSITRGSVSPLLTSGDATEHTIATTKKGSPNGATLCYFDR